MFKTIIIRINLEPFFAILSLDNAYNVSTVRGLEFASCSFTEEKAKVEKLEAEAWQGTG